MGKTTEVNKFYKPFNFQWAMELAKDHEGIHWVEDEVDLSEDIKDWKNGVLSNVEKDYITQILRLFTQSDVAVGWNYCNHYIPYFKNNEVRNMLMSFAAREGIHQRAYALLNDTLGLPDSEYSIFMEYKEMVDKVDHMTQMSSDSPQSMVLALAKSVFNEGVSLFASFVMLLNFQRFGKMKGMSTVVEWSIRDESMHVDGMCKLFHAFLQENPEITINSLNSKLVSLAKTAVFLEDKFIDLAYSMGDIEGLSKEDVKRYIRYITDRRLEQLGLKPFFGLYDKTLDKNPLPWLDWILNGLDHSNFFEKRVTEYSSEGMLGDDWGWTEVTDALSTWDVVLIPTEEGFD